jgi:UDP-2-acetamido-2,6-beta-L-arabino-hexul-4-ose reductase
MIVKVLVTGADGFIGKNLCVRLREMSDIQCQTLVRSDTGNDLDDKVEGVDCVFHLAGANRPVDAKDFMAVNAGLTEALTKALARSVLRTGKRPTMVYTSSTQARLDNPYGESKRAGEDLIRAASSELGLTDIIYRLPNVFGKWCKPNYNSVVATFCHNVARDIAVQVNDPTAAVTLVHVDDVVESFIEILFGRHPQVDGQGFATLHPQYSTTVGELLRSIRSFKEGREELLIDQVGGGFLRALYSTYVSYLPTDQFGYEVPAHRDPRGSFVEMLKTPDAGQFSYFTAYPGVTRGGHYHHAKTEKFLVISGEALFRFRNIQTGERHQVLTSGDKPTVVETIPGWTHDVTNIGSSDLVVMLWANERFDPAKPDTYRCAV